MVGGGIGDSPPNGWWWIGGVDDTDVEDANFGYYDSETRLWDQIAYDAPYYLIVKAAGNDRNDIGPAPNEEYSVIDQNGDFLSTSTVPRLPDCTPAGYDCLPTYSVAKNILTVGAVDDIPGGYLPLGGPSSVQMLEFSGWGPTDDGRIKPDVVGNGMLLYSTVGKSNYGLAMGTSMAAPNVTGSLLLLQQHYQDEHNNNSMRAATLKALVIHTADEAGDADGPDYEYGWGLLNTKVAAQVISEDGGGAHQIIEDNLSNGATDTVQIDVSDTEAIITATLVWTDPPGTPVTPHELDRPDIMLVNDLDLRISKGISTYMPWVLNPASPAEAATTGDNYRDNVEQVVLDAGGSGSYFVEVSHKGTLLQGQAQHYSLIISVVPRPSTDSSLLIDEDFSGDLPAGWSVHTTNTKFVWTINTPPIPPTGSHLDNLTGGAGKFAMVDINTYATTITSLQTPTFDLSTAEAVVLQFKNYFQFYLFDTINVDISTDGGNNWTNVWGFGGGILATEITRDLTGYAAGQASVTLRFRFDAGDWASHLYFWQIDDVQLRIFGGTPPADTVPPVIALLGDNPVNIETGSTYSDAGATANDNVDGDLTADIVTVSTVNTAAAGTYTVTYDVSDNAGNAAVQVVRTVNVTPPVVEPLTLHVGDLDATASGNKRWTATVTITVHNSLDDAVDGVTVSGTWSDNTTGSCMTNSGECSLSRVSKASSLTFTVNNLSHDQDAYDSSANHDSDGDSDGNSITINKDGSIPPPPDGNTSPEAASDTVTTEINTVVTISVLNNDSDADNDSLSVIGVTPPANGTANHNGTTVTYTPDLDFTGTDNFIYTITDGNGGDATATVTVTVTDPQSDTAVHVDVLSSAVWVRVGKSWNASVIVTVYDDDGASVPEVTVSGVWSGGTRGSCTTDSAGGTCTIEKKNLKGLVTSIDFTITELSGVNINWDHSTTPVTITQP